MNNLEKRKYEKGFEKVFHKLTRSSIIYECSLHIENTEGNFSWSKGYGGRSLDSPMVLTSVSKLFTTTCILNLIQQGKLSLQDNLSEFFDSEILQSIHVYKGIDCSGRLTVGNLLFQNTGFPDVFAVGTNCINKKMIRSDVSVSFEDYVKIAKESRKKFAPGAAGKAHYSDLNFEMLGKIIERLEQSSLHNVYKKYIFDPLNLQNTYMPENDCDFIPNIYHRENALYRPMLIRSIPASGGCISTSKEMMQFIKAFFGGKLFDRCIFEQLRSFAMIQYAPPLGQYGGGFVRLNISGIASLFRCKGELIGHMGASGAYAYYYPEKDLYFVGDNNQISAPGKLFTVPLQLAKVVSD
ncbi:serine hydrolase [Hydrogenoanaerobacterium sp.]|uniref:serine hydrolase domain-containing protein n=1 Tax=Hydrogenoanaerobacterium sp. TaxID=2953763 RepID=UPI00289C4D2A|nr:serine hydrolase [Hydrogenoanaerobacterium sp.]